MTKANIAARVLVSKDGPYMVAGHIPFKLSFTLRTAAWHHSMQDIAYWALCEYVEESALVSRQGETI
jgi:hypothetical protein